MKKKFNPNYFLIILLLLWCALLYLRPPGSGYS
jgi:hypothetical protein